MFAKAQEEEDETKTMNARRLVSSYNFSYPHPRADKRRLARDQRSSLGSNTSSAPGMMDDCSSDDLSGSEDIYDQYHVSGAELWDSFWRGGRRSSSEDADSSVLTMTDGVHDDTSWPLASPKAAYSYPLFPGPRPRVPTPPPFDPFLSDPDRPIHVAACMAERAPSLAFTSPTSRPSFTPEDITDFYHTLPVPVPVPVQAPPRPPSPPRISVFELDSDSDSDASEPDRDEGGSRSSFTITRLFGRSRAADKNASAQLSVHMRSRSDGSQRTTKASSSSSASSSTSCGNDNPRRRARADTLTAMGRRLWDAAPSLPTAPASSAPDLLATGDGKAADKIDDNSSSLKRRQGSLGIARMLGVRRSR